MNIQEKHEKILYPIVRVRTDAAGGSGSIIYSKQNKDSDEFQTFIMTNYHVVDDAISQRKEWDSVLKRDVKKDFMKQVSVEVFDYVDVSTINSSNSYKADIVAYDKNQDLAILKLESPRLQPYIASLVPREKIKDIVLFTPIYGCGCSLGHVPFATRGEVTSVKEIIEDKNYFMTSQNSIFGNSGGAVFLEETGEQSGVVSRITSIQLGFGVDVMTWMAFCVAPERIYEFFDEQELKFLYDPKDTYDAAMKRREKRQKEMVAQLLRSSDKDDNED